MKYSLMLSGGEGLASENDAWWVGDGENPLLDADLREAHIPSSHLQPVNADLLTRDR